MEKNEQKMPEELKDTYNELFQQVTWLHSKWELFCQLYASSKENVDLLNRSAPTFFATLQHILIDDALLTVSRLTDPQRTSGRDNLSLERLVNLIDEAAYPELRANINHLLDDAKQRCGFARELRNRRIAHNDLATKTRVEDNPLPPVTKQKVDEALHSIRTVMNEVAQHFEGTTVMYELAIVRDDGATLLRCLQDARTYRVQQRNLWRRQYGVEEE